MALEIYSREKHGIVILDVRGTIDISASEFIETVGWHLANHRLDILCDFKHVEMIDYAGLSVLTIAYKNVVNHDGRMKFFNVPICVKNVLRVVMLDRIFELYETQEAALHAFKEDREIEKIQSIQLRRRFKRIALDLPAAYRAKRSDSKEYKGKIFDICGEGVFLFGKKTFALHEVLTLEFEMPRLGPIKLDAKVVWLTEKDLQPQQFPGMGLEFCNVSVAAQKKIVDFVEKNTDRRSAQNTPLL